MQEDINYKYDFIVAIGRFSCPHLGHIRNFKHALEVSNQLIILIGSANAPRTIKNPFTTNERIEMISACFSEDELKRVKFNCVEDRLYQNSEWFVNAQNAILSVVRDYFPRDVNDAKIAIIGHDKDETTWYLQGFPWDVIDLGPYVKNLNTDNPVCATKIRELMFTNHLNYTESQLHPTTFKWLIDFSKTKAFKELQKEYLDDAEYIGHAHKQMIAGVYPTNFLTCDNVVIQSGHILLIQRKNSPGKNLWAIPGGFVNGSESCLDAAIRELKEETKIKVPKKILLRNLVSEKFFDHPNRSMRGRVKGKNCRTATMAFCFKLHDDEELARIAGSDDALKAKWVPIGELPNMRDKMFEDHHDIITYFISRL